MPVERRTTRSQTTTLIVSVVALAIAVILVIGVLRAASHRSKDTVVSPTAAFDAGVARQRMDSIAKDGPILFSDVSGSGQNRPIYVSHTGSDSKTGWQVIDAHPTGAPADCFLKWSRARGLFTTTCDRRTFPADGGAQHHYKWKVSGGELLIELNAK